MGSEAFIANMLWGGTLENYEIHPQTHHCVTKNLMTLQDIK